MDFLIGLRVSFVYLLGFGVFAQSWYDGPQVLTNPEVSDPVIPFVLDVDLSQIALAPAWKPGDPIKEIPRRSYGEPNDDYVEPHQLDPLLELQSAVTTRGGTAFSTPILNIDGQGFSGVNPPDTTGDVGLNYFIQAINDSLATKYIIYNKADGSIAVGPISFNSISGFCGGGGDPIVMYDEAADRWFLAEFGIGNAVCVLISQTADPIAGGWFAYSFSAPSLPDYPKFGVWNNAYVMTSNESGPSPIYAFDRTAMLAGAAATSQRFTVPDMDGFTVFQALTPADSDGDAPPPGTPAYIMRHRDDEAHNSGSNDPSQDFLELYEFSIDWVTPANSTLVGPMNIAVTEFDSSLCGLTSFSCFQQPSGPLLDPLREIIMFRLVYRNFGTHEVLLGNFVTDVDGNNTGGVRWFELRKTVARGPGAWSLYQEGTYAPDSENRWMGSIAMDESGNIALGYNVTSSTVNPGLRYVGRLASDPLGTMPQGENPMIEGTASNGSNRYGDYAQMNIDPADGCTFWFTGEYNSSSTWSTRIASFRFDACESTGCPADFSGWPITSLLDLVNCVTSGDL